MSNFLRKIRPNVFQVWFADEELLEGDDPFVLAVLRRTQAGTEVYRTRYSYPAGSSVVLDKVIPSGVLVTAKALATEYREHVEANWEAQQQAEIDAEMAIERYYENCMAAEYEAFDRYERSMGLR